MSKINVNGTEITILKREEADYVNLTEIVSKFPDGSKLIERWINTKSTVDFLGVWEQLYNDGFNSPEYRGIRENVGSGGYYLSVKKWIEATNAVGIDAKTGRYGGTYAQKDIAFEFASYVDPVFKLLLIKEFQRLKDEEAKRLGNQWDFRRYVSKVNYKIQTDAVKDVLLPKKNLPKAQEGFVYAEEADLIYLAMFGYTSKDWRAKNSDLAAKGLNIRDLANSHQLIILANLESLNSALINAGLIEVKDRFKILQKQCSIEMTSLNTSKEIEHRLEESPHLPPKQITDFDKSLKGLLSVPPPKKDKP